VKYSLYERERSDKVIYWCRYFTILHLRACQRSLATMKVSSWLISGCTPLSGSSDRLFFSVICFVEKNHICSIFPTRGMGLTVARLKEVLLSSSNTQTGTPDSLKLSYYPKHVCDWQILKETIQRRIGGVLCLYVVGLWCVFLL